MKVKEYKGYDIRREERGFSIEFLETKIHFWTVAEAVNFIDDLLPWN